MDRIEYFGNIITDNETVKVTDVMNSYFDQLMGIYNYIGLSDNRFITNVVRVEPGAVYLDLFFEDEDNFRVILPKLSEQTIYVYGNMFKIRPIDNSYHRKMISLLITSVGRAGD